VDAATHVGGRTKQEEFIMGTTDPAGVRPAKKKAKNTRARWVTTGKLKSRQRRQTSSINLRVPEQTLDLIDRAASVASKTRTDFMLETAHRHAINVLLEQRLFVLDAEQYDAFVKALDNPKPPSAKFSAFMQGKAPWER
jgi:uncharacterized protein (DUF1778 family)